MWFGREGRHGVCRVAFSCCVFQTRPQPHIYLCMHSINNLFLDHVNSYNHLVIIIYGIRRKKDNKKKLVQTF